MEAAISICEGSAAAMWGEMDCEDGQGGRPCWRLWLKKKYEEAKSLQGDPHYVAKGMAIGVFVAVTPTIPLHTAIALALAVVLKASKPAAAVGVWVSNPITIPAFYYGCYKVGMLLLGHRLPPSVQGLEISELVRRGADVAAAMILGGVLLGLLPAAAAYFITYHIFRRLQAKRRDPRRPDDGPGNPEER